MVLHGKTPEGATGWLRAAGSNETLLLELIVEKSRTGKQLEAFNVAREMRNS